MGGKKGGWSPGHYDATQGWGIDRGRLRAIVNAPLVGEVPPLTREKSIKLLVACYRMNEALKLGGYKIDKTGTLDLLVRMGRLDDNAEDTKLVREALYRLDR